MLGHRHVAWLSVGEDVTQRARGEKSGRLARTFGVLAFLVAIGAATATGLAVGGTSKAAIVLPMAMGVGLLLTALAITRFSTYVAMMLVIRASIDLAKLSGKAAGETATNTAAARALDPSSLLAVLFLLAAAVWLVARYRAGRWVPASGVRRALLLFGAAATVSVIGSGNHLASALEDMRILSVVAMFVVLEQLMDNESTLRRLLAATFLSAVFPLVLTAAGFLTGQPRAEAKGSFTRLIGTFNQSNDFGRYLMLIVIMGVALYPYLEPRLRRPMLFLLVGSGGCLVLTYTRSAQVGCVAGLLIVGLVQSKRLLAVLLIGGVTVLLFVPALSSRFSSVTQTQVTTGDRTGNSLIWRLNYWTEVLPLANSSPFTGIGLTQTQYQTDEAKQPHNDFLRTYVETGIIGFVAYLSLVISLVALGWRAVKRSRPATFGRGVAAGFMGCAVAFVGVSLVANVISNVVVLWYFFTFAAAASSVARRATGAHAPSPALTLPSAG